MAAEIWMEGLESLGLAGLMGGDETDQPGRMAKG
jgi:hypothetical protein